MKGRLVSQAKPVCVLLLVFDVVGISIGVGFETHIAVYFGNVRNSYVSSDRPALT